VKIETVNYLVNKLIDNAYIFSALQITLLGTLVLRKITAV